MSYELTPQAAAVASAEAAVVKAEQQTETYEMVRLVLEHQTAQAQIHAAERQALTAALVTAQQSGKGSSDRAWLVLALVAGGVVLASLLLAIAVTAVAVAVTAPVAVKAVRELRKDSK